MAYVIWSKTHGIYETRPSKVMACERAVELAAIHINERFHVMQSVGWVRCAVPGGDVVSRGMPPLAKAGPQS
jgi:hypothetical protein